MVRTFYSGIVYLQLMIVMCFKKQLIFGDDPLFPDGKDFGDLFRPAQCNYDDELIKVTCSDKVWGNGSFYEVSVVTFSIQDSFLFVYYI